MSWIAEYDTQGREFPTCVHVTKTTCTMTHGATYVPIEDGRAVRAENARLREYVTKLEQANIVLDSDNTDLLWDMKDMQVFIAENAKLRELIGDLREYIAGNADACEFCTQAGTCENHPAPPPCKYELTGKDHAVLDFIDDWLSELGVPE